MKKIKTINLTLIWLMICILLTAPAAGAFALDENPELNSTELSEETEPEEILLDAPRNVRAYSGYNSVTVQWSPVQSAAGYAVYRRLKGTGNFAKITTVSSGSAAFRDTAPRGNSIYEYRVTALAEGTESEMSASASAGCVRTINYKLTFKRTVTLKSKDRAKKAQTFAKGQNVTADSFIYGYYLATVGGHRYKIPWTKVRGAKAVYRTNAYGAEGDSTTAENFVNQAGFGSKTKYLIWVSLYSQRVYVFTGSRGHWTCIKNWACNTGKASTPTISGKNKKIYAKYPKNSKHKYWSRFTRYSSIHGRNPGDPKLGRPISGGCVRVDNANALFIMKKIPKKTRVVSY